MMGYKSIMSKGRQIVDRYTNTTRENMPMDETITSFADRLVDLFETVNESNGGKRARAEDGLAYHIRAEKPEPVVRLDDTDVQHHTLAVDLRSEVIENIRSNNQQLQARGAYLAICLGIDQELKAQYAGPWKVACHSLSGYWKIINNVFYG